jgi:hypothetical protein
MLRKIHGANFFLIKFLGPTNITCQNRPVLPPTQVFYFKFNSFVTFYDSFCKHDVIFIQLHKDPPI